MPLRHHLGPQFEQAENDAGQDEDDAVHDAEVDRVVVGHGDERAAWLKKGRDSRIKAKLIF